MQKIQRKSEKHTFISVVISAFNEEKYLPLCLESLRSQTYPKERLEIIVVDNNSTDKTAQIAKQYGAKVILEKQQGYVFALRKGMMKAKGDIIAVTDADTQVMKDWLLVIEKTFLNSEVVAVTGLARLDTKSKFMDISLSILYAIFVNLIVLVGKPNLSGFNFAVRKYAFLKAGGVDTSFEMSPDVDLGMRLGKIGKIKVVNNLSALTSARRWEEEFLPTLWEYTKGHVYTAWLRKSPNVKQKVIR